MTDKRFILQQPNTPTRWTCAVQSNSSDWQHYLYVGCPIVDLQGRVAGMFGGFNHGVSTSSGVASFLSSTSVKPSDRIDMVPLQAIKELLTQLQESEKL